MTAVDVAAEAYERALNDAECKTKHDAAVIIVEALMAAGFLPAATHQPPSRIAEFNQ